MQQDQIVYSGEPVPGAAVVSGDDFSNVKENWMLCDSVVVGTNARDTQDVPGWFTTLGAMGTQNHLYFFNQRTRAAGLAYCNLDTRDQMPYAFLIKSAGVTFWASHQTENPQAIPDDGEWWVSNYVPHIFLNDLPNHCSYTLQIQQDEVLKSKVPIVPAGYGPVGGGYGQTSPKTQFTVAVDKTYSAVSQSTAHISNRWKFPETIKVPRNAALSVDLRFSEYAKGLLLAMTKRNVQDMMSGNGHANNADHMSKTFYGIQVTFIGQRLVQQRGQYHA